MKNIYKTVFSDEVELLHGVTSSNKLFRMVKILEGMLWGIELHMDGNRYRLADTLDNGLCLVSIQSSDNVDERIIGVPEATLLGLSEMVSRIPDDEYDRFCTEYASSKAFFEYRRKNNLSASRK